MAKKKDRNKKLRRQLKKIRENIEIQCFNMQDPVTKYIERPDLQQKVVYISDFEDNFVRSCMWPILQAEGITDITDEELAQILVENDIWNQAELAVFVLDYIENTKEDNSNVEWD